MEFMDIVDEQDQVIGKTTQEEIYAKKHTHRIVHIFVLDHSKNSVYLQKRSATKSFLPGYYCTSAGGHVKSGETYLQAAERELQEEIGLTTPVKEVGSMSYSEGNHLRFIKMFVTYANNGFTFTDGEVERGQFMDLHETYNFVSRDKKIHPQLKLCYLMLYEKKLF